jgi:cobalt-zinc-cadmium efflux system protein
MSHDHHHTLLVKPSFTLGKAFFVAIVLNLLFVVAEFLAGFFYNSVGLISDAAHNLGDVASLLLAWLAFKLAKASTRTNYTYGFKKSTILVALTNAIILLFTVGVIIVKSISKFYYPSPVEGGVIAWVAGVGVVVNVATALLFLQDKEKDINIKGAYLHMMADAIVSVGVVISGVVILFTGWNILDPIIGLLIAIVVLFSTWNLLRDSIRLSLDGVPANVDVENIKSEISNHPEVESMHHLHIWAISTTETALTVHVVLRNLVNMEKVKHELKQMLAKHLISHVTIEVETTESKCEEFC